MREKIKKKNQAPKNTKKLTPTYAPWLMRMERKRRKKIKENDSIDYKGARHRKEK